MTPIAETLDTLQELITAGTVRAIGCSNFDGARLREADAAARDNGLTRFTAVQNNYSLLVREDAERDALPACEELGIGFVPFFPLASGCSRASTVPARPRPPGPACPGTTVSPPTPSSRS